MSYSFSNRLRLFALVLPIFLLAASACNAPDTATKEVGSAGIHTAPTEVLQADALLHKRLQAVLDADNNYVQVPDSSTTETLDERSGRIIQAEMALQKTIDSLNAIAKNSDAGENTIAARTAYFKAVLQNRGAVSDIRMALSADNDDAAMTHQTLAQLRKQLQEKNKVIGDLERSLKACNSRSTAGGNLMYDTRNSTYAPAKTESMADLRQRNKNLSLALGSLQTKYFVVGRDYLVLKKEHERAMAELATLRKKGNRLP